MAKNKNDTQFNMVDMYGEEQYQDEAKEDMSAAIPEVIWEIKL